MQNPLAIHDRRLADQGRRDISPPCAGWAPRPHRSCPASCRSSPTPASAWPVRQGVAAPVGALDLVGDDMAQHCLRDLVREVCRLAAKVAEAALETTSAAGCKARGRFCLRPLGSRHSTEGPMPGVIFSKVLKNQLFQRYMAERKGFELTVRPARGSAVPCGAVAGDQDSNHRYAARQELRVSGQPWNGWRTAKVAMG